jgi:hypothetical protein
MPCRVPSWWQCWPVHTLFRKRTPRSTSATAPLKVRLEVAAGVESAVSVSKLMPISAVLQPTKSIRQNLFDLGSTAKLSKKMHGC